MPPTKGKQRSQGAWLKAVTAGLVAIAAATATTADTHGTSVVTGNPSGCVVLRV